MFPCPLRMKCNRNLCRAIPVALRVSRKMNGCIRSKLLSSTAHSCVQCCFVGLTLGACTIWPRTFLGCVPLLGGIRSVVYAGDVGLTWTGTALTCRLWCKYGTASISPPVLRVKQCSCCKVHAAQALLVDQLLQLPCVSQPDHGAVHETPPPISTGSVFAEALVKTRCGQLCAEGLSGLTTLDWLKGIRVTAHHYSLKMK
jgi:hypothetical protein